MNPVKILIVDDEPLARTGLQKLLDRDPDFQVVAQADSARAGLEALQAHRPDAMFLDVQMPDMTGIELLEKVPPARRPVVIFVTAYDSFAIKAFELLAVDYLVKPFTNRRFAEATARIKSHVRSRASASVDEQLQRLLDHFRTNGAAPAPEAGSLPPRIVIKADGELLFLDYDRIVWIEGQGDYLKFHCDHGSVLTRETMSAMERRLDPARFMRIHKSAIVNLARVRRIKSVLYGDHDLVLSDGTTVRIGRSFRERIAKVVA